MSSSFQPSDIFQEYVTKWIELGFSIGIKIHELDIETSAAQSVATMTLKKGTDTINISFVATFKKGCTPSLAHIDNLSLSCLPGENTDYEVYQLIRKDVEKCIQSASKMNLIH
ncbi:hypothetical protein CN918_31200 [Priestia megaterium]|nr:hypothetical protein CN918_31200 [Priestia megaterium]